MKNLFHPESPVMQFLSRVGSLMIVNILFLVCSLPVITAGAALTAMHKVVQNIVMEEDEGVVKTYFNAFTVNFKQATIAWLALLLFFAGMCCNGLLAITYLSGNVLLVCKCLIAFVSVFALGVGCYFFQLLPRYENTMKQHLQNAVILVVVKLPRTVVLIVLALLPLLIAYLSMQVFSYTLVYWLIIGFSCSGFFSASLVKPVFHQLENRKET